MNPVGRVRGIRAICVAGLSAFFVPTVPPPAIAKTAVIVIDKLAYGQAPAGLRVGDNVQWINRDMFRHSVTATNGVFDLDLAPGSKGSVTLRRAGKIDYFCRYHPGMKAVLSVTN